MIYMFLSNNPSSGDINSSNLPCSSKSHVQTAHESHDFNMDFAASNSFV